MRLKPGDILYYPPHKALGVLIRSDEPSKGVVEWVYSLRSPFRNKRDEIKVAIFRSDEKTILEALESGNIEYYEAR